MYIPNEFSNHANYLIIYLIKKFLFIIMFWKKLIEG